MTVWILVVSCVSATLCTQNPPSKVVFFGVICYRDSNHDDRDGADQPRQDADRKAYRNHADAATSFAS